MKLFKKLLVFTAALGMLAGVFNLTDTNAKAVSYYQWSYIQHTEAFGFVVAKATLHTFGWSETYSGAVLNEYIGIDTQVWPNYYSNSRTWTSYYPYGQQANGEITFNEGISQFGGLNWWSADDYFALHY